MKRHAASLDTSDGEDPPSKKQRSDLADVAGATRPAGVPAANGIKGRWQPPDSVLERPAVPPGAAAALAAANAAAIAVMAAQAAQVQEESKKKGGAATTSCRCVPCAPRASRARSSVRWASGR
jgi:hypothetical protein